MKKVFFQIFIVKNLFHNFSIFRIWFLSLNYNKCNQIFETRNYSNLHLLFTSQPEENKEQHSKPIEGICKSCDKTFSFKRNLNSPVETIHKENKKNRKSWRDLPGSSSKHTLSYGSCSGACLRSVYLGKVFHIRNRWRWFEEK